MRGLKKSKIGEKEKQEENKHGTASICGSLRLVL